MDAKKSPRAPSSTRLAAVAALMLAAAAPALAQNAPAPGAGAAPPAREGNIYGHQDHQPTQADIDSAAAAAGVRAPLEDKAQTEAEVERLLKQTDKVDKQSDEDLRGHSTSGQ
ncbi:MAG: hypothetical protein ACLQJR_02910 [Stellaceae bacterium]